MLRSDRVVKVTLPGQRWAVSAARRCLADALAARGHGQAEWELAELLASEVVTNAVRHTASGDGGEFSLEVFEERVPGGPVSVIVVVTDQGAATVPRARAAGTHELSGRGLALVDFLATAWGCRVDAKGKRGVVWFEVAPKREELAAARLGRELTAGGVR
ncbi:ATP-binding protein [Nonomuraea endophytica]|uniref:ATP-binding protein n=1 Tax=Nonomuraea endophytica TaxID=714136 RepID=UPI0037C51646